MMISRVNTIMNWLRITRGIWGSSCWNYRDRRGWSLQGMDMLKLGQSQLLSLFVSCLEGEWERKSWCC